MAFLSHKQLHHLKKLQQKKFRYQRQEFLIEGAHLVQEALKTGLVKLIISTKQESNWSFSNLLSCSTEQMQKLSTTKNPQDVLALCQFPNQQAIKNQLLVLNQINDPGNLGTLIRTACAFGFSDVIVQGVDPYNSKTLRASQGAIFNINVVLVNDLKTFLINLKKQNYFLIAASVNQRAISYLEVQNHLQMALILGNEAQGIEPEILALADQTVYIPIAFESLNVASAGAILMAALAKKNLKS